MVNSTGKKSKLHSLFNMVHWNSQLSTGTTRQKHENDTKPEPEIPIWCLSVGHVAERCRRRQDGTKHEAPKTLIYLEIPSSKLTWQWNIYNLKMYFPLNMWIFHLSCSFTAFFVTKVWPELTWKCTLDWLKVYGGKHPWNQQLAPENGWLAYDRFLLGPSLFSGALAVSFRECIHEKIVHPSEKMGGISNEFAPLWSGVNLSSPKKTSYNSICGSGSPWNKYHGTIYRCSSLEHHGTTWDVPGS